MLIDWFTVVAQALNFAVLVWLMKRFLYRPIRHAIDDREKRVAAELANAEATQAEATKEREDFADKNREMSEQRAALLSQATKEAKAERVRLVNEAQAEATALRAKYQKNLRREADDLMQAFERRTSEEVFAITRKALNDLATTSLEERITDVFTRRLRDLGSDAKEDLGRALQTAQEPALVRCAFDLREEHRDAIQDAVNRTFSADIRLQFKTAPELVSGIDLSANGLKVGWNIATYLASMEARVGELIKEKEKDKSDLAAENGEQFEPAPPQQSEEAALESGPP